MKISLAYKSRLEADEGNEVTVSSDESVMKELEKIHPDKETSLVHICFHVQSKIKVISAAMRILQSIRSSFPEFEPNAILINTVPSPEMTVHIEFGSFRDVGGPFL